MYLELVYKFIRPLINARNVAVLAARVRSSYNCYAPSPRDRKKQSRLDIKGIRNIFLHRVNSRNRRD